MGFWKNLFGAGDVDWRAALDRIQTKFAVFRSLLDQQNLVLKAISRLEEKARDHHFPTAADLAEIQAGVRDLIESMIQLGGESYEILRQRYREIQEELAKGLPPKPPAVWSGLVVPFHQLGRLGAQTVGTKNANLGELKSQLGLPVPDGFAISIQAYRYFVAANHLQERIHRLLQSPSPTTSDLHHFSSEIWSLFLSCPLPDDLATAIQQNYEELVWRCPGGGLAMRSSAIDEDRTFTSAGKYVTFLNVRRNLLVDCYKKVLASQFTPDALAYFLDWGLEESDLVLGVGCMIMVDAFASGVIYTRDPLNPESDSMVVNAIFGLGSYLVEGVLTPDVFHVSRQDGSVQRTQLARKPVQLVALPSGGVGERAVPEADQEKPALGSESLRLLVEYARKVEEHYGVPQDIEWAIDQQGKLFLLQARPLRVIRSQPVSSPFGESQARPLAGKGTPVCPGAGGGPVFHVRSLADLASVPEGVVLVVHQPSPKLAAVMPKVSALVTEMGGVASHMATLAREAGLPTVSGVAGAGQLPAGLVVTVDATEGTLYEGLHADLIATRQRARAMPDAGRLPEPVRRQLERITHLNLINPGAADFRPENCQSWHDIIRFIHQKAIEEMFLAAKRTAYKERIGQRLKTAIPLLVNIIHLEPSRSGRKERDWIVEGEIDSVPMRALWGGILEEGWPAPAVSPDLKGFLAVMGTNISQGNRQEFSESSYAFLSREYMLLNLRMGYHYATIEALVTEDPFKNYIRMQYKEGGAPLERRIRRIRVICELLTRMGFEHSCEGDFLDASISYQDAATLIGQLRLVGRINILTKQLDMALANDAVAQWYMDDFVKKLGLGNSAADRQ